MLVAFTGTPGSGKTLHAVADIRLYLEHGWPVLTNIELSEASGFANSPLYHKVDPLALDVEELKRFSAEWFSGHEWEENAILLVIDEAQLVFNSRRWNDKNRLGLLTFFSQSRKFGYKIVFVAQNLHMIDNQFRMLVELEAQHRNLENVGFLGWFLSGFAPHGLAIRVVTVYSGTRTVLRANWFFPRSKDLRMYDTRAIHASM